MAENEERAALLTELLERAEGLITDAEFRDDPELRQVRYVQATCALLRAVTVQNEMIIELLRQQQEL